jgi:hypothetical protein
MNPPEHRLRHLLFKILRQLIIKMTHLLPPIWSILRMITSFIMRGIDSPGDL